MSAVQATVQVSRRFLSWWGHELADLVPSGLRRWAAQESKRTILAAENGGFVHYEEARGRLVRRTEVEGAVSRSGSLVGIRLPRSACLIRRLQLPAAARGDFEKILRLDLERSTPFRDEDIYCDHFVEDAAGRDGKVWVRQVVVKREVLDPILQQLRAENIPVDFADCWDEGGKQGLPINLLRRSCSHQASGAGSRSALVLSLCALFLSGSAVMIGLNKYETALAHLETETASAKTTALAVKRSLTAVETSLTEIAELRRLKTAKPPLIHVLDELTRLLPDTAWVSNLKIEGDALEVTIVAPSTGDLLALLARSSLFTAADLTAPVTYDPAGQSERATVRVTLKPPGPSPRPAPEHEAMGSKS